MAWNLWVERNFILNLNVNISPLLEAHISSTQTEKNRCEYDIWQVLGLLTKLMGKLHSILKNKLLN